MPNKFGTVLRELRESREMTMGELSRLLKVNVTYLSDIEHGRRGPFNKTRIELAARVLGVPADDLLEAAAESRGAFELDAKEVGPVARRVGASLMRGWPDLTDGELTEIEKIVGRKGK